MLEVFKPRGLDPFSPVLHTAASKSLDVSVEQLDNIKRILEKSCSDSQFADKAFKSIILTLTGKSFPPPVLTSLNPNTILLGSPSFDIIVHGSGFTQESVIVFNGFEEPTTYISASEVSTGVNMDVWAAPAVVPVGVVDSRGSLSNTINFTFGAARSAVTLKRDVESSLKEHGLALHSIKETYSGHDLDEKSDKIIKEEKKASDRIKEEIQKKINPPVGSIIHSDHEKK